MIPPQFDDALRKKKKLEELKAKIIEANSELKPVIECENTTEQYGAMTLQTQRPTGRINELPINLEDVFYTLVKHKGEIPFKIRPYFPSSIQFEKDGRLLAVWGLNKPLSEQPTGVIDFLHNLIVK